MQTFQQPASSFPAFPMHRKAETGCTILFGKIVHVSAILFETYISYVMLKKTLYAATSVPFINIFDLVVIDIAIIKH